MCVIGNTVVPVHLLLLLQHDVRDKMKNHTKLRTIWRQTSACKSTIFLNFSAHGNKKACTVMAVDLNIIITTLLLFIAEKEMQQRERIFCQVHTGACHFASLGRHSHPSLLSAVKTPTRWGMTIMQYMNMQLSSNEPSAVCMWGRR